jgi:hypothetical protein
VNRNKKTTRIFFEIFVLYKNILYFCTAMRKLYNLFVFSILAIFIFSFQGLSLYIHHCTSTNSNNYSAYIPSKCNHCINEDVHDCASCCSSKIHKNDNNYALNKEDCCIDLHLYAKLDILTTIKDKQLINFPNFAFLPLIDLYSFNNEEVIDVAKTGFNNRPKPPPKSGAEIIIANNCIKIPELKS